MSYDDIKNWHRDGLIAVSKWPDRYTLDYQKSRMDAGIPWLPVVRFYEPAGNRLSVADRLCLQSFPAGLPITLRYNNVTKMIGLLPRLPKIPASIPQSPLVWQLRPDGTVEDTPVPTWFGPLDAWAMIGTDLGTRVYLGEVQAAYPSPSQVFFVENNEGPFQGFGYANVTKGIFTSWQSDAVIRPLNIQWADWVLTQTGNPNEAYPEYVSRVYQRYRLLFESFNAALPPAWKNKLYTAGYGGGNEAGWKPIHPSVSVIGDNMRYNAGSPALYIGHYLSHRTDDIEHLQKISAQLDGFIAREATDPKSWREWSIHIEPPAITKGHAEDPGFDVIDPEHYGGYYAQVAWLTQRAGKPVCLRHYFDNGTAPTDPLGSATVGAYTEAVDAQVARILSNPLLRWFWTQGQPVLANGIYPAFLETSVSPRSAWMKRGSTTETAPGTKVKVLASARRVCSRSLLSVYCGRNDVGPITITIPGEASVTVPAPRHHAYWITNPLERVD